MATVLVVEDDPDQLEMRQLLLETAGHTVRVANGPAEALRLADGAEAAVLDLRLPGVEDGVTLVEKLRERWPDMRLIAVSGWAPDLQRVAGRVHAVLEKPLRGKTLLSHLARLSVVLVLCALRAATFTVDVEGEMVAELTLSAPGKKWELQGSEGAVANVTVDGQVQQQVMLFAGEEKFAYRVFLGRLGKGAHDIAVSGNGVVEHGLKVSAAEPWVAHAPVLYERKNAVGRFTDVPLLTYVEELSVHGQRVLQYTVIFSNEDGGTSTRSLMARWGRTTDIEYVYRAFLKPDGTLDRAIVQGRSHQDLPFTGPFFGTHPLLMPVTDNNMVAGEGPSAVRYQPAPVLADLAAASREEVMDRNPITWHVMTAELIREGKLREYGEERGERISDPRNYLYIEALVKPGKAATAFVVLHKDSRYYFSHTGRTRDAIDRDGWVRSTIELPPGTTKEDLLSIGDLCVYGPKSPSDVSCGPVRIAKLFFLTKEMVPGTPFLLPAGNQ